MTKIATVTAATMLAERGQLDLSARSVDAMAKITTRGKSYELGLGWVRSNNDPGQRVEHSGGGMGFWNVLRFDTHAARGVAVRSNITRHWDVTSFADEVLDNHAARAPDLPVPPPTSSERARHVRGCWRDARV